MQAKFVSIISGIFILPFIILSPYAGHLADSFKKRDIIVCTKFFEIIIMGLSYFALLSQNIYFLCFVLLLMSVQSCFFGPAKYGILPEMLKETELSRGNGYIQMWTFVGIILGSICGGQLISQFSEKIEVAAFVLVGVAVIGFIASLFIKNADVAQSKKKFSGNSVKEAVQYFKLIKKDKPLFLTLTAIAYFWFFAAVVHMNTLIYGKTILNLSESNISLLLVAIAIGIGSGSVLAGKMSEEKIEFGLVPFGAICISVLTIILGFPAQTFAGTFIRLFLVGATGGFYIVPLNAFFQQRSPQEDRGKYIAVLNIFNSSMALLGSFFIWMLGSVLKLNAATTFLVLGIASIGVTIYICRTLPEVLLKFINWIFTHSIYKVNVVDKDNVPSKGGALLVCNHISYVDPSLIMASLSRQIRFLMYRPIYKNKFINPFCRIMKAIPLSVKDSPKDIIKSLKEARAAVEEGHLVCVFAEGALSRTGNMLNFNRGFEYIMKDIDAPIIPVNIDSIWGSIFSYERGKYLWKIPRKVPYPVTVLFGKPMPSDSKSYQVRLAVQELSADAFKIRGKYQETLHKAFVREAKKRPFKFCMADSSKLEMNYITALGTVMLMSRKLFPVKEDDLDAKEAEKVGILLPSSVMASIVNGSALMAGKVPVNLNFTTSKENINYCADLCDMKRIITSRKFIEKIKLEAQDNMVFLEDLKGKISSFEKIISIVAALILPKFMIRLLYSRGNSTNVNQIATIIFSSGSTGKPKGVMLSHGNIFSNIQGFYQVANIQPNDVIMGILPFFHSFGFTAGMCFPVGTGLSVVYHNNPLDASTIGKMVEKYKATIILGTPTFFSAYTRKCTKEQFKTIRYAAAGAEKLQERVVNAFEEKFGIIPYEGYGATELSPIVAMGVKDPIDPGEHIPQMGNKQGKVGHPIPGVAAKIVDPETFEPLEFDTDGLLLIKGPNVMLGYLKDPQKTNEVIKDGWYVTGDIATIDKDGFICVTDRLSRFSKIGGEMVPHIKVEEEILIILNASEPICAVASVADEKKGERLVVLYKGDIDVDALWQELNNKEMPKLWIPKKECYFQVEEIPLLGSGKRDLRKIKELAKSLTGE